MLTFIVKLEAEDCRIELLPSGVATGFLTTRKVEAADEIEAVCLAKEEVMAELDEKAGRAQYRVGSMQAYRVYSVVQPPSDEVVFSGFTFICPPERKTWLSRLFKRCAQVVEIRPPR